MALDEHGFFDEANAYIEAFFEIQVPDFNDLRQRYRRAAFCTPGVAVGSVRFALKIWPSGLEGEDDDEDGMAVYVHREPEQVQIVCGLRLELKDGFGSTRLLYANRSLVYEGIRGFGCSQVSFRDISEAGFCTDDVLRFELSVKFTKTTEAKRGRLPRSDLDSLFGLKKDIASLYDSGDYSDVVFVCGSAELRAHRSILSCRSEVFKQMFQTNMEESRSGRVTITDLDPDAMKLFLRSLYLGELPEETRGSMEKLGCVLKAADKYGVGSLTEKCIETMVDMFTPSTVLRALAIAHLIGQNKLKAHALAYATRDRETLQDVMDLPEFDDMDPDISRELLIWSCRKRRRASGKEFPDGTDWKSLSCAQLQRACDERDLSSVGPKRDLVLQLEGHSVGAPAELRPAMGAT